MMHRAYIPALPPTQQSHKHLCLLCSKEKPSLLHRLWLCPHISGGIPCITGHGTPPMKEIFTLLFCLPESPFNKRPKYSAINWSAQYSLAIDMFHVSHMCDTQKMVLLQPPIIPGCNKHISHPCLIKKNLDAYLSRRNPSPRFKRKWSSFIFHRYNTINIIHSWFPIPLFNF